MKIALVSAFMFGSSIGGVENHIRFICKELIKNGHDVMLFKPIWNHEAKLDVHDYDGLPIQYIECGRQLLGRLKSNSSSLSYVVGFARKIDYLRVAALVATPILEWQPDLVWQHDFSSSWLATKKISKKIPVVLTNHTGEFLLLKRLPFFNILSKILLKHYSYIIGPSKELTPDFSSCQSVTIHNGVDLNWFTPLPQDEKEHQRERLFQHKSRGKFVVFCPRRWAPTKGVIFLALAAKEIVKKGQGDKFIFVFAGDGYDGYQGYAEEVGNLIKTSGIQFLRLGNLDVYKMREWYQVADLVVIPSIMEAVSLAAIEAMACGTPVLSTAVGGMPELINDGVNGYLVVSKDSDALASKILSISIDNNRNNISENAVNLVNNSYSWTKIAHETEKILSEVVAQRNK